MNKETGVNPSLSLKEAKTAPMPNKPEGTVNKGLGLWQTWNKVTFVGAGVGWLAVPALAPLWATSMAIDGTQIYLINKVKNKPETDKMKQSNEKVVFDAKSVNKEPQSRFGLAA